MAKDTTKAEETVIAEQVAPVEEAAPEAVAEAPLSLHEFCARLSEKDKRVEMIGGFVHSELRAGHLNDTASNFAARYQDFIKQPA